jgi:beta-N-acetylhexosaminidase
MFKYLSILSLVVVMMSCTKQEVRYDSSKAPFLKSATSEADSSVLSMSIDEKIGQLLVFQPTLSNSILTENLIQVVKKNRLGGVILEGLTLMDYISLVDSLQHISKVPLFNGSRNQVSLHNQFTDVTNLPMAASISAINNDTLRELITTYFIDQLSNLGINLGLVPSININTNTKKEFDFNTFENDEETVIRRSSFLLGNIQNRNILSVAGDFNELHYFQNDTTGVLDSILNRYTRLVGDGVSGIQIDPAIFQIDTLNLLPPQFLKRYLDKHAGFDGLLIADWQSEPFEDLVYSGVDLFIIKDSFENRFNTIRRLVDQGVFTQKELNDRVQKILRAKSWLGLDTLRPVIDQSMAKQIMSHGFDDYEIRRMYESSLTLLQNPKGMLPFRDTYEKSFQVVQIGEEELWEFQKYVSKYADFSKVRFSPNSENSFEPLSYKKYARSKLIITLDQINLSKEKDSAFIKSINDLALSADVVLVNFGSPLNLIPFDSTMSIVQLYERNPITESLSAQLLFGSLQAKGRLPLTLNSRLTYGHGIGNTPIIRMKYTVPEEVGIAAYKLVGIDAIALNAIEERATPGCQVLVAKNGKIIYSKSFGKQEYGKGKLVEQSDLYDLASLTKVAATTFGLMKLYDNATIKINDPLKKYLDLGKKSKIKNITLKQLMTHQSGLQSNMPIAPFIMFEDTTGTGCGEYFCKEKVLSYITPIADSMYMDFKWQDSIWLDVYNLKPYRRKRYRYSDVNFNLLMKVLETKEGVGIDDFVYKQFYNPLHLNRLTYKPLDRFQLRDVVPTANELGFRKQLIHGYVHDESAALLGGVGGNAGLFGNTESLAPLFQLLLNDGTYGGKQYLKKETVALFTKSQRGSKRGLGFDLNHSKHRSCSPMASSKTFGHTGFTGTCVWVDPESDLIFIFLSNRINPDIRNKKLFRNKTRTRMHNLVYEALGTYSKGGVSNLGREEASPFHANAFSHE